MGKAGGVSYEVPLTFEAQKSKAPGAGCCAPRHQGARFVRAKGDQGLTVQLNLEGAQGGEFQVGQLASELDAGEAVVLKVMGVRARWKCRSPP